jgi:hypothetical protein
MRRGASILNLFFSIVQHHIQPDMLSRIATAARPWVRQMSGDAAQAAKDATLWKYIGFAATAGSLTFAGVKVRASLCFDIGSRFSR